MPKKRWYEREEQDVVTEDASSAPTPRKAGKKLLLPAVLSVALVAGAGQFAGCPAPQPQPEKVTENTGPVEGTTPDGSNPPELDPDIPIA